METQFLFWLLLLLGPHLSFLRCKRVNPITAGGGTLCPHHQLYCAPVKFLIYENSEIPWLLSYMSYGSFATFPSFLALLEVSE